MPTLCVQTSLDRVWWYHTLSSTLMAFFKNQSSSSSTQYVSNGSWQISHNCRRKDNSLDHFYLIYLWLFTLYIQYFKYILKPIFFTSVNNFVLHCSIYFYLSERSTSVHCCIWFLSKRGSESIIEVPLPLLLGPWWLSRSGTPSPWQPPGSSEPPPHFPSQRTDSSLAPPGQRSPQTRSSPDGDEGMYTD